MTDDKEYSRRLFLTKFAMLSSASLLLGINSGCGSPDTSNTSNSQDGRLVPDYGVQPVYGAQPMYGVPVLVTIVSGMFFLDSQSKKVILGNNQGVPIHTTFTIDFTVDVTTSAPATVTFTDANGSTVVSTQAWGDRRTLVVTPAADLFHDTAYTLRIDDVMDANGVKQMPGNDALATFKTIAAEPPPI